MELLQFAVDVWHPDCWTLRTTRGRDGGLLGHGGTTAEGRCLARYTAYGADRDAVDALVAAVEDSPLTTAVTPLPDAGTPATLGSTARGLLVEYDPSPSIRSAFGDRGFLHHGPTRHEGGRERRTLLARTDRETVRRALSEIAAGHDADVELTRLAATPAGERYGDRLSPRQREALALARDRGYYAYPREADAGDLAAELGVARRTFLEHLRKAEAKVLGDAGASD